MKQSHHRAEGGIHGGQVVGCGQRHPAGWPVGITRELTHAREGITNGPVSWARGIGACLPISADAHHHQPFVERVHGIPPEPQALHDVGNVESEETEDVESQR